MGHSSLRVGPIEKPEGAMAHPNRIKSQRLHEFNKTPAMLILASPTLEKRDQGQSLVSLTLKLLAGVCFQIFSGKLHFLSRFARVSTMTALLLGHMGELL